MNHRTAVSTNNSRARAELETLRELLSGTRHGEWLAANSDDLLADSREYVTDLRRSAAKTHEAADELLNEALREEQLADALAAVLDAAAKPAPKKATKRGAKPRGDR